MPAASQQTSKPPSRAEVQFREPCPSDGAHLWGIAEATGLDANSPYAYVLWGEYFAGTSVVATIDGERVGFVTGFCPPDDPETLFIWQIAVTERARGQGLSSRMLDALFERVGSRWLEATVTPSNEASAAMFRSFAARHDAPVSNEVAFGSDLLPGDHEEEVRFRIGPVASQPNE